MIHPDLQPVLRRRLRLTAQAHVFRRCLQHRKALGLQPLQYAAPSRYAEVALFQGLPAAIGITAAHEAPEIQIFRLGCGHRQHMCIRRLQQPGLSKVSLRQGILPVAERPKPLFGTAAEIAHRGNFRSLIHPDTEEKKKQCSRRPVHAAAAELFSCGHPFPEEDRHQQHAGQRHTAAAEKRKQQHQQAEKSLQKPASAVKNS